MPQRQEAEVGKRGHHLKRNETKVKIIECILHNSGSVSEPEIRKYLEEEKDVSDQAGINRHLHQLNKNGCVRFIPAKKSKYSSRPGLPNHWDITKIGHLKNIRQSFTDMQLNKFEKSLIIVLKEYGYSRGSSRYIHFIILLFLSASFFNICLDKGFEFIRPIALEIYRRDKDSKNENRIRELLKGCNFAYIKGKLNVEISTEKFRQTMEELAQKREEISEEYAWRVCGILTEKARDEFRKSCKKPEESIIKSIAENMYWNTQLYPIKATLWVESFFEKFKEKVPELSKISIETVLQTQDEYQDMFMKMDEILSLIRNQQREFDVKYLDLVFEHFRNQDMFTGIASSDEIDYADRTKEIIEEYNILSESRDYMGAVNKLISDEQENIRRVLVKNKDVFRDSITYYGY